MVFSPRAFQGLQPVETLHQDKAIAIGPNQNWGCLTFLQNALGDLTNPARIQRPGALHGNADRRDLKKLLLQHTDPLYDAFRVVAASRRNSVLPRAATGGAREWHHAALLQQPSTEKS